MPAVAKKAKKAKLQLIYPDDGEVVTSVPGFVLVKRQPGNRKLKISIRRTADISERAATLLPKMAKALARPGISREAIFKGGKKAHVYAYSLDTSDPSRVIRMSEEGHRTVGRLVGERFIPIKEVA